MSYLDIGGKMAGVLVLLITMVQLYLAYTDRQETKEALRKADESVQQVESLQAEMSKVTAELVAAADEARRLARDASSNVAAAEKELANLTEFSNQVRSDLVRLKDDAEFDRLLSGVAAGSYRFFMELVDIAESENVHEEEAKEAIAMTVEQLRLTIDEPLAIRPPDEATRPVEQLFNDIRETTHPVYRAGLIQAFLVYGRSEEDVLEGALGILRDRESRLHAVFDSITILEYFFRREVQLEFTDIKGWQAFAERRLRTVGNRQ